MVDVSGIPNMGFGGSSYYGLPAQSAAQINQGIWGSYSPQQAQSTLDNIYGPGGFGAQTDYYSALGASYGRNTGGFGGPLPGETREQAYARDPSLMGPGGGETREQAYARDPSLMGPGGETREQAYARDPSLMGPGATSVFDTGTTPFNDYQGGANPGNFSPGSIPPINGPIGGVFDPNAERARIYASDPSQMGPQPAFNNYGGGANPGNFSPNPTNSVPETREQAYARDPSLMGPAAAETREQAYARDPSLMGPGAAPPPSQMQLPPNSPPQGFDPNAERAAAYARDPSLMGPGAGGNFSSTGVDPDAARAAAYLRDPSSRGPGATGNQMGSVFDPSTYSGSSFNDRYGAAPWMDPRLQGSPQPLPDVIFSGHGSTETPTMGTPTDFAGRYGAAPGYDPNSFANRFAAGGYYDPGTPSQYYTGGAYGDLSPPPPGYYGAYSFDNPSGALPIPFSAPYQPGG